MRFQCFLWKKMLHSYCHTPLPTNVKNTRDRLTYRTEPVQLEIPAAPSVFLFPSWQFPPCFYRHFGKMSSLRNVRVVSHVFQLLMPALDFLYPFPDWYLCTMRFFIFFITSLQRMTLRKCGKIVLYGLSLFQFHLIGLQSSALFDRADFNNLNNNHHTLATFHTMKRKKKNMLAL